MSSRLCDFPDMADVRDASAVQATVAAVAARQNLLILAPPGIGPTMLARRIPGVLPPLTDHQRRWLHAEYEGVGLVSGGDATVGDPPFRAPHPTVSSAALIGCHTLGRSDGVQVHRAGEAQLARFGVLFLDELDAFRGATLAVLAARLDTMAGAPIVVASARPCPCGWRDSDQRGCDCSDAAVARHGARVECYAELLRLGARVSMRSQTLDDLRGARPVATSVQLGARLRERG